MRIFLFSNIDPPLEGLMTRKKNYMSVLHPNISKPTAYLVAVASSL